MNNLTSDPLFGLILTALVYIIIKKISEKFKMSLLNPIIFSIITIIIILKVFRINYYDYYKGAEILNRLIIPATVALAVPLYNNFHILKKYYKQILFSIFFSSLILTFVSGYIMKFYNLENHIIASMLPKTVTTAIAIGISEKINGIASITVIVVIICGNIGALFGEYIFRLFKIENKIAKGIALGSTSHAVGTSKAIEMGEVEGSMSGLAIIITGIFIVFIVPLVYYVINL